MVTANEVASRALGQQPVKLVVAGQHVVNLEKHKVEEKVFAICGKEIVVINAKSPYKIEAHIAVLDLMSVVLNDSDKVLSRAASSPCLSQI